MEPLASLVESALRVLNPAGRPIGNNPDQARLRGPAEPDKLTTNPQRK